MINNFSKLNHSFSFCDDTPMKARAFMTSREVKVALFYFLSRWHSIKIKKGAQKNYFFTKLCSIN